MTVTQDPQFTVAEFRCAIDVARLGRSGDVPEPLRALAEEIAEDTDGIYRITSADIAAYIDGCDEDLTGQQRGLFVAQVLKYIENSGMFSETLQICFDLALGDVLAGITEIKKD